MAEHMQPREPQPQCVVCRDIWQRNVEAEVDYVTSGNQPRLSVCVNCIVSQRLLHGNTSGQVKAFKLLHQCDLRECHGSQSAPMWFCYDCYKYMCNKCTKNKAHSCEGKQVSIKQNKVLGLY